jgi:hypothetical protein
MTESAIQVLQQKLDNVLAQLKATNDPYMRRTLMTEMRALMADLDQLVLRSTQSYSARPDEKK